MENKVLDEFLNDIERVGVQAFVDNEIQFEAVKKVLLWEIYNNGTLKKGEKPNVMRNSFIGLSRTYIDDKELGASVRAISEALNFLEAGFKKLSEYAIKKEKVGENKNPAR